MENKNQVSQQGPEKVTVMFMLFSIVFCVCLITANILETKQIVLNIGPWNLSLTGGLIVFPISYIINDCTCEVWGYRKARLMIWVGFAMDFFFVAFGALCDAIPGAPYWTNDAGFHAIFGLAPRITFASFLAFIIGSFVNAYVMSKMKIHDQGRHFSARAVLSTIAGESLDSLVFFPLALGGVIPTDVLPQVMILQVFLKTMYEVVCLPVTIRVVKTLKRHEQMDTYDDGINYSVWKIWQV